MSVPRRFIGTQFPVSNVSTEEVGWRGRLSKWQWALAIGLPLVGAAAVAGLTLWISRRKRAVTDRDRSPAPSLSSTPVASPSPTVVKTAADTNSKDGPQEIKQRGNSLFKQGKLEEAAQCYEEAIQQASGDKVLLASCHQNLAAVYDELVKKDTDPIQKTRHRELVIENCDRAISLDPRYVKALLRRFKMHLALGHQEEALLDVTRVLLLDESHAQSVSTSVTVLLRDISQAHAAKTFPTLGPLPPTKYLVKTYIESYIWKDDISEERLKALWVQAHTPPADQTDNRNMSHESTSPDEPIRETGQGEDENQEMGGDREVVEGSLDNGGSRERGEEGDGVKEGEGEGIQKEDQAEEEGEEEGGVNQNGGAEEATIGFLDEPFVQAAAQFQNYELTGILDVLTQAIDKGHNVFKAHALLLRGTLHALWRMEDEALRDLQDIVNTQGLSNEMYVNALIKKAGIFAGRQSLDKCKTCFEKAENLAPNSIDILVHRARVSLETEDLTNLQSVITDLSKAVTSAPDQPYPLYSLASSFHRLASVNQSMQLIEAARTKFQEALKRFPKFADGLILYALFLQDMGDFQQAEQVLNKVVNMEPDNPLGHFSLGLLFLVSKSDIDQTMLNMQKAIAVDISCVQAYDTMASIEMQRGNIEKAVDLYDKAVRYSRNQVEMTQAYVAQKVFSMQDRVCKEYGVSINQIGARSVSLTTGSPAT